MKNYGKTLSTFSHSFFCVVLATFSLIDATSWKRHSYSLNLRCAPAYAYSHSHSHSHTPACAWAWGRGIDACIMSPNGSNNYKVEAFCMAGVAIIMTITRGPTGGWQEKGVGVVDDCVGSSSGVALRPPLVNLLQLQSKSFEYIRKFLSSLSKFMRHMFAMSMRAGQRWGPAPVSPPLPVSYPSITVAVPRQWPLAIIRRNKRQLSEAN